MNLNSKNEAFDLLTDKRLKDEILTEEEKQEILKFFTLEELADLSFDKINISKCFSHHS